MLKYCMKFRCNIGTSNHGNNQHEIDLHQIYVKFPPFLNTNCGDSIAALQLEIC